jgi:DNA integrity scanning protein DisA with diadenylate cyclase activity/mannitol/fructose-specific phosphotransferase system IIA component (Ntr-type)
MSGGDLGPVEKKQDTTSWYRFESLLKPRQIVRVKGDKRAALTQLAAAASRSLNLGTAEHAELWSALLAREAAVNTQLGPGWAAPHVIMAGTQQLFLVVGRSQEGLDFGRSELGPVHLIFFFVTSPEGHGEYLRAVSTLAKAFRENEGQARFQRALNAKSPERLAAALSEQLSRPRVVVPRKLPDVTRKLIKHLLRFASDIEAEVILLFADVFRVPDELAPLITKKVVLATRASPLSEALAAKAKGVVRLSHNQLSHESAFQLALLQASARGLIGTGLVVSACGDRESDDLDSIRIETPASLHAELLDAEARQVVSPEVLERAIEIAVDLAEEGREGAPMGMTMVLGDYENVRGLTQQLTINPFKGYSETERSILDPTLEETVKEFAAIDGAFVIGGDGVIQSAGTYLSPPADVRVELVSGLGARHRAGAAMSKATKAVVIVLSQSTGRVTIYRQGREIMAVTPPRARIDFRNNES